MASGQPDGGGFAACAGRRGDAPGHTAGRTPRAARTIRRAGGFVFPIYAGASALDTPRGTRWLLAAGQERCGTLSQSRRSR
jgi:hypothetical protein